MKCPYCGDALATRNSELYCTNGNCGFPEMICKLFEEITDNLRHREVSIGETKGIGHFFCISCGNRMEKIQDMHEICLNCGIEINRSLYFRIIEFCPHK